MKVMELILPGVAKITGPLVMPSESDVAKYAPPAPPEDDFLTFNSKGYPVVRNPVGIRESELRPLPAGE